MKNSGTAPPKKRTRILLVDDHPLVRESLRRIIEREADLSVCGETDNGSQALELVAATKPHLVILDLTLKDSHGLELVKNLSDSHPEVLTLVFSMHEETLHAERVIRAGARGYLCKEEPPAKVLQAIRKVLSGEIYWSEKAANWVASQIACRPRPSSNFSVDLLTDRELQVFELMGEGQNTRQIASVLHIDASTVETYRARMKEKLHLKNSSELLQYAIRFQMLPKAGGRGAPLPSEPEK
jgi:DNA-binding NarL/FixJ family response regulator